MRSQYTGELRVTVDLEDLELSNESLTIASSALFEGKRATVLNCDLTLENDLNLSCGLTVMVGCRIYSRGHRIVGGVISECVIEL